MVRSEWGFDGHFPQNWLLDSAAFNALQVGSLDWAVQKVRSTVLDRTAFLPSLFQLSPPSASALLTSQSLLSPRLATELLLSLSATELLFSLSATVLLLSLSATELLFSLSATELLFSLSATELLFSL